MPVLSYTGHKRLFFFFCPIFSTFQLHGGLDAEKVAEKIRFLFPVVQNLVDGLDDDQKKVLRAINAHLKTNMKYRHHLKTIKKHLLSKRDLSSLMGTQLGGNSVLQGDVDPKVFMTMMLQNLLNNEKSKQLGHFMNFFLGQFSEKFQAELFLNLFKITKKKISPNDGILLEMLWNPVLKRLMQDLNQESTGKIAKIKETYEESDDEDAKILAGYFKNALSKRKKRNVDLQFLGDDLMEKAPF